MKQFNFNQTRDYKTYYYKFYNTKKKWLQNNANIWFNRTCLQKNIIPKYAKIKNKPYNYAGYKTNQQYSTLRIKNENKFLYHKKNCLSLQLYHTEMDAYKLFGEFWTTIKSSIIEKLSNFIKVKYQTLNKKLQNLLEKQKVTTKQNKSEQIDFQFHDPIKNLTKVQFSNVEYDHISKGFKSNFYQNKKTGIK